MNLRAAAVALAAIGLIACAGPYLPPGSRPAASVNPYRHPDFRKILPGSWLVVGRKAGDQGALALPNIISRSAEVAGVKDWREVQFAPDGTLRLVSQQDKSTLLNYHFEGNELHVGERGPHVEHDVWQIAYEDGALYMRSLDDSEVLTLARERQPASAYRSAGGR